MPYLFIFIYYEWSYNMYIVQEESANKVIKKLKKIMTTQNLPVSEIKSHTSSYANMLPSEKN